MGNITDDIRQHFDTFAELPFTEADSLALSQLAYARMPDNVPRYHENAETADGMILQSKNQKRACEPAFFITFHEQQHHIKAKALARSVL